MSAHESLAAGLIGVAGAIFAGWLAFTAVQEQLAEERSHRERERLQKERAYDEAKEVGCAVLAQPVHAAASTLFAVNKALAAKNMTEQVISDQEVQLALRFLDSALNNFGVREIFKELRAEERMLYVSICSTLATLVDISKAPGRKLGRPAELIQQRRALLNVSTYLRAFSSELANVYERDSGVIRSASSSASEEADAALWLAEMALARPPNPKG
jgi:hypothetical protein